MIASGVVFFMFVNFKVKPESCFGILTIVTTHLFDLVIMKEENYKISIIPSPQNSPSHLLPQELLEGL